MKRFFLGLLAVATLGTAASGAVQVVTPDKTVFESDTASHYIDIGFSGSAGELVAGWDYFFTIEPQPGAVGSVTVSGDFAIASPVEPLFASNPLQSSGATNIVSDVLLMGDAEVTDTKHLFRLLLTVAPGTQGVFAINVMDGPSVLYDGAINDLGATFTSGLLTVQVPEPASLGLLAIGGLLLRRRRA